jgi:predicted nucleic acid-binding protein
MSVVSNASPLISLARIGKLDLLRQLYGELLIPKAVWHEVVIEAVGREVARHLGLRYTGLIGVLVEAKHKDVLTFVIKPHLDALRDIAGFRIRDALYVRILQDE